MVESKPHKLDYASADVQSPDESDLMMYRSLHQLEYASPVRRQFLWRPTQGQVFGLLGFLYGLFLFMLASSASFMSFRVEPRMAIGLFSSPLGVLQSEGVAFLAIPIVWCVIGSLLGNVHRLKAR